MTLNPYGQKITQTARLSAVWGAVAFMAAVGFFGLVLGVEYSRSHPQTLGAEIIGPTTVHAGEAFMINPHMTMPRGCSGRTSRHIDLDRPIGWPANQKAPADLLPSDPMPDDRPGAVPVPLGDRPGCGTLYLHRDTAGCGALSGILPPMAAESNTLRVCILPPTFQLSKAVP